MDDLFDLADWFDDCAKKVEKEIEREVEKGALKIADTAKMNCPVDTGHLRESIHSDVEWQGNTCIGIVGTNVEYAPYIEYGTGIYATNGNGRQTPWVYKDAKGWHTTRGMMAQPFMYPAFYATKDAVFREIVENIGRLFN